MGDFTVHELVEDAAGARHWSGRGVLGLKLGLVSAAQSIFQVINQKFITYSTTNRIYPINVSTQLVKKSRK